MDNILPNEEITEVEGRAYLNPQVGLDESTSFIDNLRATQGQQNQEIAEQTYNLGTAVPSVQGGLGTNTPANMNYFTSRYQTPMTNSNVANLRAAAQATALNEVLANEQAIWKKKYQDAYRAYQKRNYNRSRYGSGGGGGNTGGGGGGPTSEGGVDYNDTALTGQGRLELTEEDLKEGGVFLVEPASGNIIGEGFSGNNPRYVRNSDGSYTKVSTSTSQSNNGKLSTGGVLQNNAPLANALRSNL